jgi:hypothetical protein
MAWEFSMTGSFNYYYRYATALGPQGFFSNMDRVAQMGPIGFDHLQFWLGGDGAAVNLRNDLANPLNGAVFVSGKDTALQTYNMDIFPQIRINPAVRIRGKYHIGPGGVGARRSEYYNSSNSGLSRTFAVGEWQLLWLSAQTPAGILIAGKRPFAFGFLFAHGESNTTSESFGMVVPYGPFRFILVGYPSRAQAWAPAVYNTTDSSFIRNPQVGAGIVYSNGPLQLGFLHEFVQWRNAPEGQTTPAAMAATRPADY